MGIISNAANARKRAIEGSKPPAKMKPPAGPKPKGVMTASKAYGTKSGGGRMTAAKAYGSSKPGARPKAVKAYKS